MASFKYMGRHFDGSQAEGTIVAGSSAAVADLLARKNITPISINIINTSEDSGLNVDLNDIFGFSKVSLAELIVFCRQMYALMRSGVPILRAINGMVESTNSKVLEKALVDIGSQLEGGYALSSALNQHKKIFGKLFISLIHVGENTGQWLRNLSGLCSS